MIFDEDGEAFEISSEGLRVRAVGVIAAEGDGDGKQAPCLFVISLSKRRGTRRCQ